MSINTTSPPVRSPRGPRTRAIAAFAGACTAVAAASTMTTAQAAGVILSAPSSATSGALGTQFVNGGSVFNPVTVTYLGGPSVYNGTTAYVVDPGKTNDWAAPVPGSKWVTPDIVKTGPNTGAALPVPTLTGTWEYQQTFTWGGGGNGIIEGLILTDDNIIKSGAPPKFQISLNGTLLNYVPFSGNKWKVFSTVTGNSILLGGGQLNTLRILIDNGGRNVTGTSYALTVTPEPGVVAFGVLSVAGIGGMLLRGRLRVQRQGGGTSPLAVA